MAANTYDHILTKGPESALPATPENGKLRFTTDTGRLFIDGQNTRTEITDFVKGLTEAEIKAQLAPLVSKIYVSSDTNKFLIYNTTNNEWDNIAVLDTTIRNKIEDIYDTINGEEKTIDYTSIINIDDAMPVNGDITVKIEPVQDLHGYSKPWIGGAGKNLIPMTVDGIKALNSKGSWSGNTYTYFNVEFKILTDDDNNVIGINVNGTNNSTTTLFFSVCAMDFGANVSYKFNGGADGGSSSTYFMAINNGENLYDSTSDKTQVFVNGAINNKVIIVVNHSGVTVTNKTFHPMIRLATESDTTFEPYTNICSISRHNDVRINCYKFIDWSKSSADNVKSIDYTNGILTLMGNGSYQDAEYIIPIFEKGLQHMSVDIEKFDSTSAGLIAIRDGSTKIYVSSEIKTDTHLDFTFNTNSDNVTILLFATRAGTSINGGMRYSNFVLNGIDLNWNSHIINLNGTYYGGTVHVDKNGNAELLVDRAYENFDGSEDENWSGTQTNMIQTTFLKKYIKKVATNNTVANIISNKFAAISANNCYTGTIGIAVDVEGYLGINLGYSITVENWKTYLASNNLQVCYELAIPFTVSLNPIQVQLLKGNNILYANTGDIKLSYNTGIEDSINNIQNNINTIHNNFNDVIDVIGWDNHKNLLPMTLDGIKAINNAGTWNDNSYTWYGITFTVQTDEFGNVSGIFTSGTSTQQNIALNLVSNIKLPYGEYHLNGSIGGVTGTYRIDCSIDSNYYASYDGDSEQNLLCDNNSVISYARILVRQNNVNMNDKVFYPMIRKVSDTDPTFQPYHPVLGPTVEELQSGLTNVVQTINHTISYSAQDLHITGVNAFKNANTVCIIVTISLSNYTAGEWNVIGTLPSELRPRAEMRFCAYNNTILSKEKAYTYPVRIQTNGELSVYIWGDVTDGVSISQAFTYIADDVV